MTQKLQQRVDRRYLLRVAEEFRDHKKGIPEWLKNSDDSYTRHEEFNKSDFKGMPIILSFNKNNICCIDFGGADAETMIEHIPHYGSPDSSTHGRYMSSRTVSGGHGNGGKYYALSQFKDCKIISYYKGKLTVLRINKDGDWADVKNKNTNPWEAIEMIGLDEWKYFKIEKIDLLKGLQSGKLNIFCWMGLDPKDKKSISNKQSLTNVLRSIADHPQSRSALRDRCVDVLLDGNIFWPSLKPEKIEIDEFFGIREFSLPNNLEEYKFNKHFNSILKIQLSKKPLISEKSSLNILEIDSFGKNIAHYDIPALMLDKGLSKSISAQIDCPELREYMCVSNDRANLIDGEVSSLFLSWCRSKIQEVLDELVNKEMKKAEKKDLDDLGNFLKEMANEISDLLEEDITKLVYNKSGEDKSRVDVPTDKPGFGSDGKAKKGEGGKRGGGKENKEDSAEKKMGKGKLNILLSNHDSDPLDPEGKPFNMIEREPILFQRVKDIEHGIWWINSQKRYVRKIKIKDPRSAPFYFFLIKEIVLSHRARRRFKEQEGYTPDGLEELNFNLIDEIFNKVAERVGVELSETDQNITDKIREAIKKRNKFTVPEITKELNLDPTILHMFVRNPANHVMESFNLKKIKNKNGRKINMYVRK